VTHVRAVRPPAKALSVEYTNAVAELAHRRGLKLHIDGARIFNAAAALKVRLPPDRFQPTSSHRCACCVACCVALQVPVSELVAGADTVTFCLSKGLCAPVGSVLVGSKDFIAQARRARKMLGGTARRPTFGRCCDGGGQWQLI
jgi:threonine aldolase